MELLKLPTEVNESGTAYNLSTLKLNGSNCSVYCDDFDGTDYMIFPNQTDTNYTMEEYEPLPAIRQPVHMIFIYSIAFGIVFLFALFGNIVVVVLVTRTRRLHTLTNFFIVNLAVADILVAVFCVPITLLDNLFNGR